MKIIWKPMIKKAIFKGKSIGKEFDTNQLTTNFKDYPIKEFRTSRKINAIAFYYKNPPERPMEFKSCGFLTNASDFMLS